jgi:hypothetical protein
MITLDDESALLAHTCARRWASKQPNVSTYSTIVIQTVITLNDYVLSIITLNDQVSQVKSGV